MQIEGSFPLTSAAGLRARLAGMGVGVWSAVVLSLAGQNFDRGPFIFLLEENDLIVNTDRHYTQGLQLGYLGAEGGVPTCLEPVAVGLPSLGFASRTARLGYLIGQSIFTPNDISLADRASGDRPYAGWLYGSLVLQRRGVAWNRFPTLETLRCDVGIVGPQSLAEHAQTWVHKVRGFDLPQGWDHQLGTEPGLAFRYHRTWLLGLGPFDRLGVDVLPHVGFSLGNVETSVRAGFTARFGWNLPDGFGLQTIDSLTVPDGGRSRSHPAAPLGVYLFTSWEGQAVGYSVFLDGTVFRPSQSVERQNLQTTWKTGLALVYRRWTGGFTHVFHSREFSAQLERDRYGSLFLSYAF